MSENRRDRGIAVFESYYGPAAADGLRAYLDNPDAFGRAQAEMSMEMAFGTVWANDRLDPKLRSCAVLGMMIGLRQFEELKYHTRMGLKNGLTQAELEEIMLTSVPYCGLPASNVAKAAMLEVLRERDEPA